MGHTGDVVKQWLYALEIWQSVWDECNCMGVSDWAALCGVPAFYLKVSKVACFLLSTDNFRYTCDICGKKYKYYSCFQEHRDLHAVDGEYCFDTQTPKLEWEVVGEGRMWFYRTVRPMMYRTLHSMACSPLQWRHSPQALQEEVCCAWFSLCASK